MTDCAPATTPLAVGTQLCRPKEDYKATAADTLRYQKALGELNYLVVWTRPDIAFAVSTLSKYCSNPSPPHFGIRALRHLYRYPTRNAGARHYVQRFRRRGRSAHAHSLQRR